MFDLVLRDARLLERDGAWDIGLRDGLITAVRNTIDEPAVEHVDLYGRLLVPGFVDAHLHLDKAYLEENPYLRGLTGAAFFAALRSVKERSSLEDVLGRMRRALEQAAAHGTTTIRAQIDVDDVAGMRGLEAALALKAEFAARVSLQIVAFPQEGLVNNAFAAAHMRDALRLGADVVGGGATFDGGLVEAHVQRVFELAAEFDRDVDLHADLATAPETPIASWELAAIAGATQQLGWQGRVTVAHLTQLGQMEREAACDVADLMVQNGINVTVVPCAELNTATSWDTPPAVNVDQAMSRLDVLLERGVNLSYATGHVADAFSPYGCGDMLLDGLVLACARNLGNPRLAGHHVLTLGTSHPARTLRLPGPHSVEIGAPADLVCLDAPDADCALRHHVPKWLVMKAGRIVRHGLQTPA